MGDLEHIFQCQITLFHFKAYEYYERCAILNVEPEIICIHIKLIFLLHEHLTMDQIHFKNG